jgi:hypothetical protein
VGRCPGLKRTFFSDVEEGSDPALGPVIKFAEYGEDKVGGFVTFAVDGRTLA